MRKYDHHLTNHITNHIAIELASSLYGTLTCDFEDIQKAWFNHDKFKGLRFLRRFNKLGFANGTEQLPLTLQELERQITHTGDSTSWFKISRSGGVAAQVYGGLMEMCNVQGWGLLRCSGIKFE